MIFNNSTWQNTTFSSVDGYVEPPYAEFIAYAAQKILVPTLVCLGLLGNLMTIHVLTRRHMQTPTNCYLTALAFCDLVYALLFYLMSLKFHGSISETRLYAYLRCYGKPTMDTASNAATWLVVCFTAQRFIAITCPMRKQTALTNRPLRAICYIYLSTAAITSLEYGENKVESETLDGRLVYFDMPTSFGRSYFYEVIYIQLLTISFTYLPVMLLLCLNTMMVVSLLKAQRRRNRMVPVAKVTGKARAKDKRLSKNQAEHYRITIMLISLVFMFIICQIPSAVFSQYLVYTSPETYTNEQKSLLRTLGYHVFNTLLLLNYSTNFLFYSCFSKRFRRHFLQLYCHRMRRVRAGASPTTVTMRRQEQLRMASSGHGGRPSRRNMRGATNNSDHPCMLDDENIASSPSALLRLQASRGSHGGVTPNWSPNAESDRRDEQLLGVKNQQLLGIKNQQLTMAATCDMVDDSRQGQSEQHNRMLEEHMMVAYV